MLNNHAETPDYISPRDFLVALKSLGVPLKESLPLYCRLHKISIKSIYEPIGYSRAGLYLSLKENRRPRYELYQSVIKHLGVDPWAVYDDTGNNEATKE